VTIGIATAMLAADALFPQPLHLTRRIEDPVSHTTTTVEEYCAGDQIITVTGEHISIADHGKQEVTEINRADGTYSVTSFADLARAESSFSRPRTTPKVSANSTRPWTVARTADHAAVTFSDSTAGPSTMDLRFDDRVRLSKAAFEVLIGAAFPHHRSQVHEALLGAGEHPGGSQRIVTNGAATEDYAIPVEQTLTFDVDGDKLTVRNTVLEIRTELAPPGTATIPPGSRLVESHAIRLARELRQADELPGASH
jgi:hypothetical protein